MVDRALFLNLVKYIAVVKILDKGHIKPGMRSQKYDRVFKYLNTFKDSKRFAL